ncbi:GTPase family protein [Thaumasiovibrio subtropicus]|uniref:GTPase family protein n=1 Tax=Thaumasiovibrio subtropicus TaxID=1891207 RepID=UPI00131A8C91|nr:GTPase [Thaumasiovibrio subtropicus]
MNKSPWWQWFPKMKLLLVCCWLVPILGLAAAGGVWLWQQGLWWIFFAGVTLLTVSSYSLHFLQQRIAKRKPDVGDVVTEADPAWGEQEQLVWREQMSALDNLDEPEWGSLYPLCLAQFERVALIYYPDNSRAVYAFTLPELLQINEEVSRRYRQYVDLHLPLANQVRIDKLIAVYGKKDQIQRGWRWANNTYRVARWINPMSAVMGEIRGALFSKAFDEAGDRLQYRAKRLLLEQSCAVAIDLYSGRWQLREEAPIPMAADVQPVTVSIMGQTNAGKSSLVNQLLNKTVAETDVLSTTAERLGYLADYEGDVQVIYQDTPGVTMADLSGCIETAVNSDLLIWTMKATQSARQIDVSFFRALNDYYVANPERRFPPMLVAITHIDQLGPDTPLESLNIDQPDSRKAQMVADLVNHLKLTLPIPEHVAWVPVCTLPPHVHNVSVLETGVIASLDDATGVQLNRRRHKGIRFDLQKEWRRAVNLGKVVAVQTLTSKASKVVGQDNDKKAG